VLQVLVLGLGSQLLPLYQLLVVVAVSVVLFCLFGLGSFFQWRRYQRVKRNRARALEKPNEIAFPAKMLTLDAVSFSLPLRVEYQKMR